MITGSVGRRYAKALSLIAQERGNWDEIRSDLENILPLWESEEMENFIKEPSITRKERAGAVVEMAKKLGVNEIMVNFLQLLAIKGRLEFFPDIVREFSRMWEEKKNRVRVVVVTPAKLSDRVRKELEEKVKSITSREPIVFEEIDESLVGGIKVIIEGKQYDGSIRTRIKNILQEKSLNL